MSRAQYTKQSIKGRRTPPPLHHHLFGRTGNALLAIVIVGSFAASLYIAHNQSVSPQMAAVLAPSLIEMTNTDRHAQALGTLTVNSKLTAAAQAKANDEASKGYFSHVSPDGHDSWYWFKQAGYSFAYAGENLAVDFTDASDVESAWLASPTHRRNILDSRYTQIGIATAMGSYKGHTATFVVQMFGTPTASAKVTGIPQPPSDQVAGVESGAVAAHTNDSAKSPTNALKFIYFFTTVAILITLAVRTRMELHIKHLRHAGVGAIALVSMLLLLLVADQLSYLAPLLPSIAASAVGS